MLYYQQQEPGSSALTILRYVYKVGAEPWADELYSLVSKLSKCEAVVQSRPPVYTMHQEGVGGHVLL